MLLENTKQILRIATGSKICCYFARYSQPRMKFSQIVLLPLAWLYGLAVRLRNYLYDIGYSRSFNYDIMVILVGNLRAGGTGKSPMVEYLIRLLQERYTLAVLSRGYKRQTKGFRLAAPGMSAHDLGDEAYQMYLKYGKKVRVAVGEERTLAIPTILLEHPETQVILMDDGYQHRAVRADLNILLTSYQQPFYEDYLLPAGRLREPRNEVRRAQMVVVTKCPPTITASEKKHITQRINSYAGGTIPVFFATIAYGKPRPLSNKMSTAGNKMLAFAGLADPSLFFEHVQKHFEIVDTVAFADHYNYTSADLQQLAGQAAAHGAGLITTEKDVVKLRNEEYVQALAGTPLYYVPIETRFLENGNVFDEKVWQAIDAKYAPPEDEQNQPDKAR